MTLEEKAEEYAIENYENYEEGQNDYKALKAAYIAGATWAQEKAMRSIEAVARVAMM